MRRFIILFCLLALAGRVAMAGTFPLADGTKIIGTPDTILDKGVVFQLENGDLSPRITWDQLTPQALRELMAEAKTDAQREVLRPLVENIQEDVAKRKEIVVKPIQPPDRPKTGSGIFGLFGSPVGWFIFLVLYGANLFAAYEVHVYRRQPLTMVCGLAAIPFFGVLSPIIYGVMPTQAPPPEPAPAPAEPVATEATGTEGPHAAPSAATGGYTATPPNTTGVYTPPAPTPAASAFPEPVVFKRGEFSFNRRFFETKFAGFFRVVPSEAEKDLVLMITAARGQFVGRRIMKITPNEVYLQVFHNNASADEMIPFTEIAEVQIRHKDNLPA